MATHTKLDFDQYDGASSGWHKFRRDLLGHAVTLVDASGSTVAEHYADADMGGGAPGAPPMPNVPAAPAGAVAAAMADLQKMGRLRQGRQKVSLGLLVKHISNENIRTALVTRLRFSQNPAVGGGVGWGRGGFLYLEQLCDKPVTPFELEEMNTQWNNLSIAADIGIVPDSITQFRALLDETNSRRPLAERFDDDKVAARILQAIWQASRYFAEGAMNEYNRPPGLRTFQLATGVRDLQRLQEHYHGLWSAALKAGTLTRTAATRGAAVSRQTVDRGLLASVAAAFSPSASLRSFADETGLAVRGCCTTSDFSTVPGGTLTSALDAGGAGDTEFALESTVDGDGVVSLELVCYVCCGIGHRASECPSPRKQRSFDYAISLLQNPRRWLRHRPW